MTSTGLPRTEQVTPQMSRRVFFYGAGATSAAVAFTGVPAVGAQTPQGSHRTLVVVFCRGGYDGLSLVAPTGDPVYQSARSTIAVPQGQGLALTGPGAAPGFVFHPAAQRLSQMFTAGKVAVVNGAGVANPSRSHFSAQAHLETADMASTSAPSGWLARWLDVSAGPAQDPLRAVAIGAGQPTSLRSSPTTAASGFDAMSLFSWAPPVDQVSGLVSDLYRRGGVHPALVPWAAPALGVNAQLAALGDKARPVSFPDTQLGNALWPVARLVEAGFPVDVAHVDMGGWDTHEAMGQAVSPSGVMYRQVAELDAGLGALFDRLGPRGDEVTVVVLTEFGRRVSENASGGTDHGRAFPMFIVGGGVRPGVHGAWPGLGVLDADAVPVGVDYRSVLAEVLSRRFAASASQLSSVFPGFSPMSSWAGAMRS